MLNWFYDLPLWAKFLVGVATGMAGLLAFTNGAFELWGNLTDLDDDPSPSQSIEATNQAATDTPMPSSSSTTSETASPTPAATTPATEPDESPENDVVEALYQGEALTLDPPALGYQAATLIDFDDDAPALTSGAAADQPGYDIYYDHEYPEEPSAYFRVHSEHNALLADGPDTRPEDPAECEEALLDAPLRDFIPQSGDTMLEAQGGYCLRTTEGDTVWFSVNSVSGEEKNHRFVFLVTLWPAD